MNKCSDPNITLIITKWIGCTPGISIVHPGLSSYTSELDPGQWHEISVGEDIPFLIVHSWTCIAATSVTFRAGIEILARTTCGISASIIVARPEVTSLTIITIYVDIGRVVIIEQWGIVTFIRQSLKKQKIKLCLYLIYCFPCAFSLDAECWIV